MDWTNLFIAVGSFILTIVGVIVTLSLGWGKFDKRLSLMHQRLDTMEGNHLAHIQAAMQAMALDMKNVREIQIRMEETLKNKLQ